jgi:hypothetical protein
MEMTMINDQKISDTTPSTASGETAPLGLAAFIEALGKVRSMLPFPLQGLDTDNDGAFINQTLIDYCRSTTVEFTRSRAYKKNDQAWIEQKNGAIVRRLVGYGRLEGIRGAEMLSGCMPLRGFT